MLRLYSRFSNIAGLARTQSLNASSVAAVFDRAAIVKRVGPVTSAAVAHARHGRLFHSSPLSYSPETKDKDATKAKTSNPKAKSSEPEKKAEKAVIPKKKNITMDMKPPKRPATPFMLFFKEYFTKQNVQSPNPEAVRVLSKQAAQVWKDLTIGEKQRYQDQSRVSVTEYHNRLNEWFRKTDIRIIREYNRRRVAQGKQRLVIPQEFRGPKRPVTGYIRFSEEIRPTLERGSTSIEMVKQLATKWNALPADEKERYNVPAREEMKRWHAERAKEKEAGRAPTASV